MDRNPLTESRRAFLRLCSSAPAVAGSAWSAAVRPPDVLFIIVEDLQACLSSYGNKVCRTPHIDALAAGGVRFEAANCQYPLCNPTRSSLLSGLRPPSTGVLGNDQDWNERLAPGSTMPEAFRAAGYETIRVGKIFHAGNAGRVFDDTARWSRIIPIREGISAPRPAQDPPPSVLYDNLTAEERAKNYDTRAWVWGPQGTDDLHGADGCVAEQGVRVLGKKQDRPLFLALGFHKPHLELRAPARYFDTYPPSAIRLPDYPAGDLSDAPHKYSLANHKAFNDAKRRGAIAAYYACVSYVDACVGRVMSALKEGGRDRNTIVVFMGDHGFHLGEHLLWQKMTLFEESCRVPFAMSAPGLTAAGGVCRRPVECIDLFPTLADLCGVKPPGRMESISMAPLLRDPARAWKKGAFTYLRAGKSVRTERFRYSEWGGPENAELYDRQSDPREIHNVARHASHSGTVRELSALLAGDWKAALPG